MLKGPGRAIHRHLSAADERFGLRLGAGLVGTFVAAVTFALLLLLVRAGWAPLGLIFELELSNSVMMSWDG